MKEFFWIQKNKGLAGISQGRSVKPESKLYNKAIYSSGMIINAYCNIIDYIACKIHTVQ